MRRLLAAAAIAATLLVVGGCSADRDGGPGTAAPASGSPGAPAASATPPGAVTGAAGGNAQEVCAAATKASSESARAFIVELARMLEAANANDTKAADRARRKAEGVLAGWAAALEEQSGRATDGQLKAVLAEVGAEVGTLKADINSVDEVRLDGLQQRLDRLCGG
jgi:hypothetical protein